MLRTLACVILVLTLASTMIGCRAVSPPVEEVPPAAPEDVLSVWHFPPSPQGFPPLINEEFVLGRYGSGSDSDGTSLSLTHGEWIDVIVKSKNMRITFYPDERPGTVGVRLGYTYYEAGERIAGGAIDLEDIGAQSPEDDPNPFRGKMLYPWPFYLQTHTGNDIIYTMAFRLFALGMPKQEHGPLLNPTCKVGFTNYNVGEEAEVSCEVYKLATITPEWGYWGEYRNNVLLPWFNEQGVDPSYSSPKAGQMWKEWLEQFK